jgi:diguanylate cyclase (GGDEF)-like protein/PAS domain S-box-containing protein
VGSIKVGNLWLFQKILYCQVIIKKHKNKYQEVYYMNLTESIFSPLFNDVQIGILVVDENMNIVNANEYLFKLFNPISNTYQGKKFGNLFGCAFVAKDGSICGTTEKCNNCNIRNTVINVLNNINIKDNDISHNFLIENNVIEKLFIISTSLINNENGKNILITFIDKTESKLSEIHLNENKEKFDIIDKNTTDMICIHEPNGRFIYLSSSCKNILGYEPEELIGISPYDLFSSNYIDMIRNKHDNILQKTDVDNVIRYEMKRKDNSLVWLETVNGLRFDKNTNEVSQIISVSRVVNEKVEQEITMEKMVGFSEELLKNIDEENAYQNIIDNILYLSKAKYGVLNLFDENGENFTTVAIGGAKEIAELVKKYFGFEVVGKKWNRDIVRENKIKDGIITRFSSLIEIAGGIISKSLIKSIEKMFNLDETIIVKIVKDERVLGDFTLIMSEKKQIENLNLIEIYSKQIGMYIIRKRTEQALEQRDKLLQAISLATKELLSNKYDKTIGYGLEMIGKASNVDRAYYFQNHFDQQNNLKSTSQIVEWCSNSSEPQINNQELLNVPAENIEIFLNTLKQGKPFTTLVDELEESFTKEVLKAQQIVSILVLPIFVNEIFWGFIGFDDCKSEREWTEVEISTLRIYIDSLSKIIEREQLDNKLKYHYYHDQLTDLYSRKFIFDNLNIIENENQLPLSIISFDINGLRIINESYGFVVGDEIIKKVAKAIKTLCGNLYTPVRWGGDDFLIFLPNVKSEELDTIIKEFEYLIKKNLTDELSDISVAIGSFTKEDSSISLIQAIKYADENMIHNKVNDNKSIQNAPINMILQTLHEKNNREQIHSKRVGEICAAIGQAMEMSKEDINKLRIIGSVHDIGKIGIDENILNKPSGLTDIEYEKIKQHSEIGFRILSANKQTAELAYYVLSHHERLDGTGYPNGIKGDNISLYTRILALADSYDAMTKDRTYRKALSNEEAIAEMKRCSGTQFDADVVNVFVNKVLINNPDFSGGGVNIPSFYNIIT